MKRRSLSPLLLWQPPSAHAQVSGANRFASHGNYQPSRSCSCDTCCRFPRVGFGRVAVAYRKKRLRVAFVIELVIPVMSTDNIYYKSTNLSWSKNIYSFFVNKLRSRDGPFFFFPPSPLDISFPFLFCASSTSAATPRRFRFSNWRIFAPGLSVLNSSSNHHAIGVDCLPSKEVQLKVLPHFFQ